MTANPLQPIPSIGAPPTPTMAASGRFTPLDPVRVLRQYVWFLVITTTIGLIVGLGTWYLLRKYRAHYAADARVLVMPGVRSPYAAPDEAMALEAREIETFIRNLIPRLTSEDVLADALKSEVVRRSDWYKSAKNPRSELAAALEASPIRGTTQIRVAISGGHPGDLPVILDRVVDLFVARVREDLDLQTAEVRRTFASESAKASEELRQIEEQQREFAAKNDLHMSKVRTEEDMLIYESLAAKRTTLEVQLQGLQQAYAQQIESQRQQRITPTAAELALVESEPTVLGLQSRTRAMREQRIMMLRDVGENHPVIQNLDHQMQVLESERSAEVDRLLRERRAVSLEQTKLRMDDVEYQLTGVNVKLEEARGRLRDVESKLAEMRALEARTAGAIARRDRADKLLDDIRVKSIRPDNMRIRKLTESNYAWMTFPQFSTVVFSTTFAFLGLALGLVFIKELLDQRIKTPQDVRLLPNSELLGVVPDSADDPSGLARIESAVQTDPNGLIAEAFRQLRTALLSRMDRRGYKTLVLVGAQPGAGVSAVLNNLAISAAHNGRRVLVIDANFRRPQQHRLFSTRIKPGLYEVLKDEMTFEQAVQHVDGMTIDVLSTGNGAGAPPDLLEGSIARNLLSDLEGQYDLVLIDAPPALVASDCQLLAKHVDAVAAVVRAMSEKRGMVTRMLRQLEGYRADVLGVVLNGVKSSAGGYFRKSYQTFYRYRQTTMDEAAQEAEAQSKETTSV